MLSGVQWLDASLVGLLGLLFGSFLNVVVYRLPKMMERQWAAECAELSGKESPESPPFNLMVPRSRCPHCGHAIRWFENIPIASYLVLGGKCSACKAGISPRYPVVELATGALFFWCAWQWGVGATGLAWCAFSAMLLALALIDWDTTLLPDDITLPLLWLGLIAAALQWTTVPLSTSLWGAVAGYLSLWTIYWAFKLVTGKEGMGYGDFKLFAALGAWFGWPLLIPMILLASVIGAIVGIGMKFTSGLREGGYVPFGPFLAGAGLTALLLGPQVMRQAVGL
ncbi:A24 family peptidase [Rhodoferax saidenbachensis]|uniref:Prepilin leader peptidase/N-methyltransferase n=1 Tax=Rhodoferax saidenbachensis TaxID=1484693 RepID=A0ABU1ZJB8_9BURK|nr:A24 family peptidase [Rhodoferax saidenbachensis]MDR7305646.1 leader peptidase (prepilin peptidase)/N-methyltransferase [Rhodoferax saidenbachensis]